jgi:hypothetical protein
MGGGGDVGYGRIKGLLVGARRLLITTDFAHKLPRSSFKFLLRRGTIWIPQLFDIAAHEFLLPV